MNHSRGSTLIALPKQDHFSAFALCPNVPRPAVVQKCFRPAVLSAMAQPL